MADTEHETVIVPRELHADEYGTIWKGSPGEDGSCVVGDLLWIDDEGTEAATVMFLPVEEWQVVRHDPELTLGGQMVTDDEAVDGGHLTLVRRGEVPSWMERVGFLDNIGTPHKGVGMSTSDEEPRWIYAVKEQPSDGE